MFLKGIYDYTYIVFHTFKIFTTKVIFTFSVPKSQPSHRVTMKFHR